MIDAGPFGFDPGITIDGDAGTDRIEVIRQPGLHVNPLSVYGGPGDDTLDASRSSRNVNLRGEAGDDVLQGGGGADRLDGGGRSISRCAGFADPTLPAGRRRGSRVLLDRALKLDP